MNTVREALKSVVKVDTVSYWLNFLMALYWVSSKIECPFEENMASMGSGGALASLLVQNNRSDGGTVRNGYEFCRANGHVQPLRQMTR